ncbi:uncharacterized protein LOC143236285 [Tachypleus tridentatus]|uniref:uncharacterized protein LOC143236285 n=1 Tax=Tachypleus tridentatus TaxID=6853 RepID=UPI003FD52636
MILIKHLNILKISLKLKKVIIDFIQNREIFIESITKKYNKMIPQGSSLDPILWNLYIDGMLKLKSTNNANIQLKYLGIIIGMKLNCLLHLNFVKSKIVNVIQKLKKISRATWGLKPKVMKDIYILSIEKKITYGYEIWFENTERIKSKILQIQRIAILPIAKTCKTVASLTLNTLTGIPPLDIKLERNKNLEKFCSEAIETGDLPLFILFNAFNTSSDEMGALQSSRSTEDNFLVNLDTNVNQVSVNIAAFIEVPFKTLSYFPFSEEITTSDSVTMSDVISNDSSCLVFSTNDCTSGTSVIKTGDSTSV